MCEFSSNDNKMKALKYLYSNNINLRLPDFKARFSYAFQFATCPVCGAHLTDRQMKPSGRATRCMCVQCYKMLVADRYNANCLVCQDHLPADKVQEQLKNRREIRSHMHEGQCWSIWVALHNIVLGETAVPKALGIQMSDLFQLPRPQPQPVLVRNTYKDKPVKLITF